MKKSKIVLFASIVVITFIFCTRNSNIRQNNIKERKEAKFFFDKVVLTSDSVFAYGYGDNYLEQLLNAIKDLPLYRSDSIYSMLESIKSLPIGLNRDYNSEFFLTKNLSIKSLIDIDKKHLDTSNFCALFQFRLKDKQKYIVELYYDACIIKDSVTLSFKYEIATKDSLKKIKYVYYRTGNNDSTTIEYNKIERIKFENYLELNLKYAGFAIKRIIKEKENYTVIGIDNKKYKVNIEKMKIVSSEYFKKRIAKQSAKNDSIFKTEIDKLNNDSSY